MPIKVHGFRGNSPKLSKRAPNSDDIWRNLATLPSTQSRRNANSKIIGAQIQWPYANNIPGTKPKTIDISVITFGFACNAANSCARGLARRSVIDMVRHASYALIYPILCLFCIL